MITTLAPVLTVVSRKMKESTVDTSSLRIGYGNDACRHVLSLYKWGWAKKELDLVIVAGTQEYDLTSQATNYSPIKGIWEVYVDGDKIDPIDYNRKDTVSSQHFYLKPDDKTIGFTEDLLGDEDIDVWYYPLWALVNDVGSSTATIPVSFPDEMLELIAKYVKYLIHDGKRQRYDARNALLDFKQDLDTLIPQQGSSKIKDRPRHVANLFAYTGHKRTYTI